MAQAAPDIKKILSAYARELLKRAIRPTQIVLFGSHATGKAGQWSDIDVSIISVDLANKGILERQILLGRANQELQAPLDVVGYTPEEWEHSESGTLLGEIRRTGIPMTLAELSV